jgi:hypothetical protein
MGLGDGEILIAPRLGSLARKADFKAEIESAGDFAWAAEP